MAVFRPFKGIRPAPEFAREVAALPYDVVSTETARQEIEKYPESFLKVDRAEAVMDETISAYDPAVYEKAAENLRDMRQRGVLIQDMTPCYYLYEQKRKGHTQTGIVGCTAIDDYLQGTIKKHELTRKDKLEDRIRHVDACDANTGPIFLTCVYPETLLEKMENWKNKENPIYSFVSDDEVEHRVWIVDDSRMQQEIQQELKEVSSLYIADGHHRAASAVEVGCKKRRENPDYTGEEEFNYFMSVVFPSHQLKILPYNRAVKGLDPMTEKAFLGAVKFNFELMVVPGGFAVQPFEKHCFGMYLGKEWYHLKAWPDVYENKNEVEGLDVSILQKKILEPLLKIQDPTADERLVFKGGPKTVKELMQIADDTQGVAFQLYPVSIEEIMKAADAGLIMPPKSTWFEPKLRSGLFIHDLESR